jgi:hypothetical protein
MPRKDKRGSNGLQGRKLTEAQLKKIVAVTKRSGTKIVDWSVLGTPLPELVAGTVQVSSNQAGRLVGDLLKLRDLRPNIKIFPFGTPRPDLFTINFRF